MVIVENLDYKKKSTDKKKKSLVLPQNSALLTSGVCLLILFSKHEDRHTLPFAARLLLDTKLTA